MGHATLSGFGNTVNDIEPLKPIPDISENIQQTLTRLMLWDNVNKIWRDAASDIDGRLIISMSGVSLNQANFGVVGAAALASLIFPVNPNRREIVFENVSTTDLWIGFNNALTTVNGFRIPRGGIYSNDRYTGEYWIIALGLAPSSLAWQEF